MRFNRTTDLRMSDPNSWYHIVYSADSWRKTGDDIHTIYVNGQKTTYSSITEDGEDNGLCTIGFNYEYNIGRYNYAGKPLAKPFYLADLKVIDGLDLGPDAFGTYREGVWIPKEFDKDTYSYGTYGYHLDFANADNLGKDASGNDNDWAVN